MPCPCLSPAAAESACASLPRRFPWRQWLGGAVLALAAAAAAAAPVEYDLCVRGIALEFTQTLRVRLTVDGADVSRFAASLGAKLANERVWKGAAEQVFGAPYDPVACSAALGDVQAITITLTEDEAQQLAATLTRAGSSTGKLPDAVVAAAALAAGSVTPREAASGDTARAPYVTLRVFYATDRNDTGRAVPAAARYGGERGDKLAVGAVNVTIPASHEAGKIESPSILKLEFHDDPNRFMTVASLEVMDNETWRKELRTKATELGNQGVLLFIHGYNVSFEDAALRTGQLVNDLGFGGAAVFFSWPSRAEFIKYPIDEQSAEWAIPDMKLVLAQIAGLAPNTPVYVIAHSMGNRVLARGMKELLDEDLSKRRVFRQVVLAAPDIDADVFKREIAPSILGKVANVTLYASSNDKALEASRVLHGGVRRLGETGPGLTLLPGLDTVDASNVSTGFLGHSYYGDNTSVMSDLFYLIRKSMKPQEREKYAIERVNDALGELYWRFKGH